MRCGIILFLLLLFGYVSCIGVIHPVTAGFHSGFDSGVGPGWNHPLIRKLYPNVKPYDRTLRPRALHAPASEGYSMKSPVEVELSMYLRDVEPMETTREKQEVRLQMTLRQRWCDPRLNFAEAGRAGDNPRPVSLVGDDVDTIWTPDTFVRETRESKILDFTKPNRFARVAPDGTVTFSERVSLTISCPEHNAGRQRGDKIVCKLGLASYGYQRKDVDYKWSIKEPMKIKPGISVGREYGLEGHKTLTNALKASTGEYALAEAEIMFVKYT